MRTYKCDRCGKFFEKGNGQKTSFFITAFNPHGLDLCPNCNAKLQEDVVLRLAEAESEGKE